jgi:hypothetical protein
MASVNMMKVRGKHMRAFHTTCGSNNIVTKQVQQTPVVKYVNYCGHCDRLIEESEIHHTDRRISAVTYKGKAYVYGRECK